MLDCNSPDRLLMFKRRAVALDRSVPTDPEPIEVLSQFYLNFPNAAC